MGRRVHNPKILLKKGVPLATRTRRMTMILAKRSLLGGQLQLSHRKTFLPLNERPRPSPVRLTVVRRLDLRRLTLREKPVDTV